MSLSLHSRITSELYLVKKVGHLTMKRSYHGSTGKLSGQYFSYLFNGPNDVEGLIKADCGPHPSFLVQYIMFPRMSISNKFPRDTVATYLGNTTTVEKSTILTLLNGKGQFLPPMSLLLCVSITAHKKCFIFDTFGEPYFWPFPSQEKGFKLKIPCFNPALIFLMDSLIISPSRSSPRVTTLEQRMLLTPRKS